MKKEAIIALGIIILFSFIVLINAVEVIDDDQDGFNSSVDCNDSNANVWYDAALYSDNDNDSYGAGNAIFQCLGNEIPLGYSNFSSDCNDTNSSIWNPLIGYLDRDRDDFGDNIPISFCLFNLPNNYASINGDCEDTNPNVFPNSTELCNNLDDDCDGQIDEDYPNRTQACYVGVGECRNQGIMICNKEQDGTFCKGISKKPTLEICDGRDNDCDGSIDEDRVCDIVNTTLNVFMPSSSIFNSKNIKTNISILTYPRFSSDSISYIDNSATKLKNAILCKKCNDFGFYKSKFINLKDGEHNLTFNAVVNGSKLTRDVILFVDSKKPKILLPSIRSRVYTNGSFYVNYDESNIKNITLFLENKTFIFENCSSGKNQICKMELNLGEYEGKNIIYRYFIADIADNSELTKNITAEVDLTPPKIENITYPVIGNYVFFKLNITEKNFKNVAYFDNSDDNPKWRILCSVLKGGICEKEQRLRPGEHNITLRVLDKAENSVSIFI